MEVWFELNKGDAIYCRPPAAIVSAPNSAIRANIEVGPVSVLLVEPAIGVPAQAQIQRHAAVDFEIIGGKQRHAFPAPIQGGGDALRSIVYFAEHEVGEGKAHGGPDRVVVRRQGLAREVIGPNASVVKSVHATHLRVAAELEAVPPAHPRNGIVDDEIVGGIALVNRRPNACLGESPASPSVNNIIGGEVAAVRSRASKAGCFTLVR